MARTSVQHLTLTVSTVEVFIKTMQFIEEHGLWKNAQAYLAKHGKTEMFIDYEVLDLFREMLKADGRFSEEDPVFRTVLGHIPHK